jgi:hypothetical protein
VELVPGALVTATKIGIFCGIFTFRQPDIEATEEDNYNQLVSILVNPEYRMLVAYVVGCNKLSQRKGKGEIIVHGMF